jgi:hypothetical protein
MECIRGESKLNIKTLNSTLKFSFKRPVRTHHYLNTYIRFIMQYRVINVDTISFLERRVTEFINEGWIPQGGICTCYEGGNLRFYQVMIKTV